MTPNPVLDFEIDKASIQYVGDDLHRPECILAERDGTLWAADARGGVARINPDGAQEIVTQKRSGHFDSAGDEATRFLHGTLPNGLDRKSTRLNSSHLGISYAVFCLKKKT